MARGNRYCSVIWAIRNVPNVEFLRFDQVDQEGEGTS